LLIAIKIDVRKMEAVNTNYYLRLDGIRGLSKAKFHPGEIEVLNYSLGPFSSNTLARGGGGGVAGRTSISELSFTKKFDIASIMLREFCTRGRRIAS
jgi:type VI secretion system secreted protein Hcp